MAEHENELAILKTLSDNGLFEASFYENRPGRERDFFSSYEDFLELPFMVKSDIRNSPVFSRTTTPPKDVYGIFSSSGTTGKETFYVYNQKDKSVHAEFVRTFFSEVGVGPGDLGGVFAPVGTGVMAHSMLWQFSTMGSAYVNCPTPDPDTIAEFVTDLPISVIASHPGIMSGTVYRRDLRDTFRGSEVNTLALGGMFLSEPRRQLLEERWDAKCYSFFGMSEVFGPMAAECRAQSGLHYLDKYLMIEVLDPRTGKPVEPGNVGLSVCTTLWDKGFPLLRYVTDDYVRVDASPCECGSPLPRLIFEGRAGDCLTVGDGQVTVGPDPEASVDQYFFPKELESIIMPLGLTGEYQLRVDQPDSLTLMSHNWRELPPESLSLDAVEDALRERLGTLVTVDLVDISGDMTGLRPRFVNA